MLIRPFSGGVRRTVLLEQIWCAKARFAVKMGVDRKRQVSRPWDHPAAPASPPPYSQPAGQRSTALS